MVALHKPFTRTGAPIMVMDCASAELSKYASNALLATKISFMNEIANICDAFGADVDLVRQAIGSDRRIGPSFLFPGVGYGGSCFPKDVKALVKFSADRKYDFKILQGRGIGQRAAEAAAGQEDGRVLQGEPEGQDHRRLGPGVQAEDRRHARGAGGADHQVAAREGRQGAGLRSRGDEGGQGHLRRSKITYARRPTTR